MPLDQIECSKILDLHKAYGSLSIVVMLISISKEHLVAISNKDATINFESETKLVRAGIRRYWKSWMGKSRLALDNQKKMITLKKEADNEIS